MTTLRQAIFTAAAEQGVKTSRLAEIAGTTRQTVQNWRAGRTTGINSKAAQRMLDHLGLTVSPIQGKSTGPDNQNC